MRCHMLQAAVLTAGVLFVASASAQEIVHALSGTVTKVDSQAKTITLKTNDGSEGTFSFPAQKATQVDFDRNVQAESTPVASFDKANDTVVVFFYGNSDVRTAVAVKDLGAGPFDTVEGTVTRYDKHQHVLTLKNAAGKSQSFQLHPKAVADTMNGAVPGDKFEPAKGDNVRVIATKSGTTETAMFVRD